MRDVALRLSDDSPHCATVFADNGIRQRDKLLHCECLPLLLQGFRYFPIRDTRNELPCTDVKV